MISIFAGCLVNHDHTHIQKECGTESVELVCWDVVGEGILVRVPW